MTYFGFLAILAARSSDNATKIGDYHCIGQPPTPTHPRASGPTSCLPSESTTPSPRPRCAPSPWTKSPEDQDHYELMGIELTENELCFNPFPPPPDLPDP